MHSARVQSVDLLRGAVMIVMALDHTREYFHAAAQQFNPEDLAKTTAAIFFTRWITHFCAPVFVFLAGVSVHLASSKRPGLAALSRHLIARGLWLIAIELTLMQFAFSFNFYREAILLQVIWVIGCSLILLAGLVWLPRRLVAALSIAVVALHNLTDGIPPARFGQLAWLWKVLHVPGIVTAGRPLIVVLYPLVPWIAVLAAGYCFGPVLQLDAARRRRVLLVLGAALTFAFIALRLLNVYGDPRPWKSLSILDFLRTNKYPPSLDYLLMTLGPSILALGLLDGLKVSENNPFRVFGRVPMFYYVPHFYMVHGLACVFALLRYGRCDFLFHVPGLFPVKGFPANYGYNLAEVYLVWLAIVASLYLPCRWYMRVKQSSRSPWLSYI